MGVYVATRFNSMTVITILGQLLLGDTCMELHDNHDNIKPYQ